MKQEDKNLLLQELSTRFEYQVKGLFREQTKTIIALGLGGCYQVEDYDYWFNIDNTPFVPYLRPLSSITQDEIKELNTKFVHIGYFFINNPHNFDGLRMQHADMDAVDISEFIEVYEWLNAHHFDYRGLIEKGLALEAPENMYK